MNKDIKIMTPPIPVPAITLTITARTLLQLNFVMASFVNQFANIPARIIPNPLQPSETARAVVPCFSLAPLRVSMVRSADKMIRTKSRRVVIATEVMAGVFVCMVSPLFTLNCFDALFINYPIFGFQMTTRLRPSDFAL